LDSRNFNHLINQVSLSTTAGDIDKPINKNFLSTTLNIFYNVLDRFKSGNNYEKNMKQKQVA